MENYHFEVNKRFVDGERFFDINLSRENIDFLLQGCPELECISGRTGDVIMRIYSEFFGGLPKCFDAMPDSEYHARIGVFLDKSAIDRSSEQVESDLVEAINSSPDIPLLSKPGLIGRINLGYARIRVV